MALIYELLLAVAGILYHIPQKKARRQRMNLRFVYKFMLPHA